MIAILPSDPGAAEKLMNAAAYSAHVKASAH
jgi:hypothetical protein